MIKLPEMGDRIRFIIANSGLTKTAFAQKINISQGMVSMLASGKATPSDRTIADICREFCVNELWLRSGEGEVFYTPTRREEIASYLGELLGGQRTEAEEVFISLMSRMTQDEWQTIARVMDRFSAEWNKEKHED